jgi:manganese efflux pump family protein
MLMLSVATSIDALAVGLTFAFLGVDILQACLIIGSVTFAMSAAAVGVGHYFGEKLKAYAGLMGGILLICIGVEMLWEHLLS